MSGPFWARCAISFSMRDVEEAVFFLTYVSDSQRHTYVRVSGQHLAQLPFFSAQCVFQLLA